ncbi:MAG: RNA polymerase sigma factor [Thiohalospira sp.]
MTSDKKNIDFNSDAELLRQYIATGNLEILGDIFNQYIHLVYGVCLKYLNDREESKDAVNRIFENLVTEIPKFEIQNFRTWLYVVTKNYCLMEIRKRKTERKRFEKYSDEFFMESTNISHPIDEAPDEMLEKHLNLCIEKLKQEQKNCIQLFYYEKRCYKEISEELNIDQNKVKSFIQNGKRNLKICIEQLQAKENV